MPQFKGAKKRVTFEHEKCEFEILQSESELLTKLINVALGDKVNELPDRINLYIELANITFSVERKVFADFGCDF